MDRLLIICGPTATGKTALALSLAKKFNGELVSADSRQVYKGMDIGTGKDFPNGEKNQLRTLSVVYKQTQYYVPSYDFYGIALWMYDIINPNEAFTVSHYQHIGRSVIADIRARGKLPIIVGGTGLYIDSLVKIFSSTNIAPDTALRSALEGQTVEALQEKLHIEAPDIFAQLNNSDKHNPRRLIRKIELASAGITIGSVNSSTSTNTHWVGLHLDMTTLKERIAERVEARIQQGQVNEVQSLVAKGYGWELPSLSGLGYGQWKNIALEHIQGADLSRIVSEWKTKELQYAKRQMTWFRKNTEIHWFDVGKNDFSQKIEQQVSSWYTT